MQAQSLFSWPESLPFKQYFPIDCYPWKWIPSISIALNSIDFSQKPSKVNVPRGVFIEKNVWLDNSVQLPYYACIHGPTWIGPGTIIRPGCYIRGNVIVGANSILGNSCEYKNCLLMNNVKTAHFNYVGDSILGNETHLGAGVILANLRFDKKEVLVESLKNRLFSGLKKLGAIIGDSAEVGCNSVLQPGTILGKHSLVMPSLSYGGFLSENSIALASSYKKIKVLKRRF